MKAAATKMKFLATKLAALESELQVSREIMKSASSEVTAMFNKKYHPEVPIEKEIKEEDSEIEQYSEENASRQNDHTSRKEEQNHQEDSEKQMQASAEKFADPEVKKMFKKIALQCHPDKLEEMEDGFEKLKKQELYQKARQALENNDIIMMASISSELGLEIPEITHAQLKATEQKIATIKKELKMIESTAVWQWFFTEDKDIKDKILKQIFDAMYGHYNVRT